jgi:tetratricopeptide (TPR) repeat protein
MRIVRSPLLAAIHCLLLIVPALLAGEAKELDYAVDLFDSGSYELAARQCEYFQSDFPDSDRLHQILRLAMESHFALGDFQACRAAALRLSFLFPDSPFAPDALLRSADCLVFMGRREEAAQSLMRFADFYMQSPDAPKALLRAASLLGEQQLAQKRELLHRFMSKWPEHALVARAQESLGDIYEMASRHTQALRQWQKALMALDVGETHAQLLQKMVRAHNGSPKALVLLDQWLPRYKKRVELDALRLSYLQVLQKQEGLHALLKTGQRWWPKLDRIEGGARAAVLELLGDSSLEMNRFELAVQFYAAILAPNAELRWKKAWVLDQLNAPNAPRAWADAFQTLLAKDSLSALDERLFLGAFLELLESPALARKFGNSPAFLAQLKLLDEGFPLPQALLEFLYHEVEFAGLAELMDKHPAFDAEADERHFLRIRLAQRQADYRLARRLTQSFLKYYTYSELRRTVEQFHEDHLAKLDASSSLNSELLALMAKQNAGGPSRALTLAFGQLYLGRLSQPAAALEQFESVCQTGSDTLATQALWGQFQAHLMLNDLGAAEALREKHASDLPHELQPLLVQALLPGQADEDRLRVLDLVDLEVLDSEKLVRRYQSLAWIQAPWALAKANQHAFVLFQRAHEAGDADEADMWWNHWLSHTQAMDSCEYSPTFESRALSAEMLAEQGLDSLALPLWFSLLEEDATHPLAMRAERKIVLCALVPSERKRELVESILRTRPYHEDGDWARSYLPALYLEMGEPDLALGLLQLIRREQSFTSQALDLLPMQEPHLALDFARCLEALGQTLEARRAYEAYLRSASNAPKSYALLLRLATQAQAVEPDLALRFLTDLAERLAEDVLLLDEERRDLSQAQHRLQAGILASKGEDARALDHLEKMRADESGDAELRALHLRTLYLTGGHDAAKSALRGYLKEFKHRVDSDTVKASMNLAKGSYLFEKARYDDAAAALKHVLKHFDHTPHAIKAALLLAEIYAKTGQDEKALHLLKKELYTDPASAVAIRSELLHGQLLRKQGEIQPALRHFTLALQRSEAGSELRQLALMRLVIAYREGGFPDGAMRALRQYVLEFPEAEDRFSRELELALLLKDVREYDRAMDALRNLLDQASPEDEVAIQFYIGECLQLKGAFSLAILQYMKVPYQGFASKLDWDVTALYQAGRCHEELAEITQAIRLYERIVRLRGAGSDYGKTAQDRMNILRFREGLLEK